MFDKRDLDAGACFALKNNILMEGFDEGTLLMRLEDYHLFELNPTANFILRRSDGRRSSLHVAASISSAFRIPRSEALKDIVSLYKRLSDQGIVEMVTPRNDNKRGGTAPDSHSPSNRYVVNPDAVLREEDEDGGLLFNPDTGQVKVLNPVGLFIWQHCDGTKTFQEIVTAVMEAFEEAPADQVDKDVEEFIREMMGSGFIGATESFSKMEKTNST